MRLSPLVLSLAMVLTGASALFAQQPAFGERLFGLLTPSTPGYTDFVSPMTNPVNFEDPRTLTEARTIFLNHRVPTAAGGGGVQLYAMQLRAAVNDWLSVIATKDGYIVSSNPLIDDGFADVALGLKANLFADPVQQRLLSAGFTYEIPSGSLAARQGNGDGEWHLFVTGGMQILGGHWVSGAGLRIPSNPALESQLAYWSNHFDRRLFGTNVYGVAEVNWYHWVNSGGIPTLAGVEGGDLFNFGSTGVAGNDIVTGAIGLKWKPRTWVELGTAFEVPLTARRDVIDNRLTVDCILRY